MDCTFCGGVYHPATGCAYGHRVVACGPCTREFWRWARGHMATRKGRPDFYAAAAMWKPEVREAEARQLASRIHKIWARLPHYHGTISLVQRLSKLVLGI